MLHRRSLLLVSVLLVAGCAGGGDAPGAGDEPRPLPACARAGAPIERPQDLPRDVPVPPGTVLTTAQRPFEGQLVVNGLVPYGLDESAAFFREELERAGYALGRSDAEAQEREALFTGRGVRGGWRVNAIAGCEGAVRLTLVVLRQPG